MPAMHYRIWQWGKEANDGTADAYHVGITVRAKRGNDDEPFIVANELVALRLGRAMGLPIPEGVIIEREDELYFASLNFNVADLSLPPADPAAIAQDIPDLACGVLVFDIWIMNDDRWEKNLHYDKTKKALYVFDQGHALYRHVGIDRLRRNADSIGIGPHCLVPEISNLMHIQKWVDRLFEIPDYYIRDSVREAVGLGVGINDLDEYVKFLKDRRGKIIDLIKNNRTRFSNAGLDLFFGAGQLSPEALDYQI